MWFGFSYLKTIKQQKGFLNVINKENEFNLIM